MPQNRHKSTIVYVYVRMYRQVDSETCKMDRDEKQKHSCMQLKTLLPTILIECETAQIILIPSRDEECK